MVDKKVDTKGLTCPRPLVETKKALKKMEVGETLEVVGDHGPSKAEVPEAMEDQGHEIVSVKEKGGTWRVVIKKKK
jgi:TusA-related sulfurtransferase